MEFWQITEIMTTGGIIVAVLVPVFGLKYRFLVKPAREEPNRLREGQYPPAEGMRDARLDQMERQLEGLEASVRRLVDVTEFDRQLKSGKPPEGSA